MSRFELDRTDVLGIRALIGIGTGAALVQGPGWGLIVVSVLVIVYLVLPDEPPGGRP